MSKIPLAKVVCLVLAATLPSAAALAVVATAGAAADDFAWLAGDWRGTIGDGDLSQEVWTAPAGGELMGMWRWVSEGQVRLYEFFTISLSGEPVLRLRHFSRELEPWESERAAPLTLRLVARGEKEATFEGTENGKTVRLTYRRVADDELLAVLEEEGGSATFRYRLQR